MRSTIFILLLLVMYYHTITAQSFTAELGDIYSTDDPAKYSCSVTVLSGILKKPIE